MSAIRRGWIVDPLEAVEIEEDEGEPMARPPGPLDRLVELAQDVAAVVQPRQEVGRRQIGQRLDQSRVLLLELVAHRPHGPEHQPEEKGVCEEEQVHRKADDRYRASPEEAEPQVVVLQGVVREAPAEGLQVRGDRLVEHGLPKCKPDAKPHP